MQSLSFRLSLAAAALALASAPAMAQRPNPGAGGGGDRGGATSSNGGGGGGDHAVARGSAGASAGSTSGSSSSGSTFGAAAPSFPSSSGFSSRPAFRESAPQRRTQSPRSGASQSGGERAVPRGGAASAPSSGSTHVRAGASETSRRAGESTGEAVPGWARPRDGQPTTGKAVQRTTPYQRPGTPYYYYPSSGYYWGYPGYPYGVGNYYGPYTWALGVGYGIGFPYLYDPWYGDAWYSDPFYGYGDPFFYGAGGYADMGGYAGSSSDDEQGSLRLKVKPRDAKVYVDGYLVGAVDDMDGVFQKLPLNAGHHRVQVKADGYAAQEFDVMITPGETATFEGDLKRIQ